MAKSSPATPPKTTGELRQFLLDAMADLRDGKLDIGVANTMQKMAAQINESLYAELKAVSVFKDDNAKAADLGSRFLTDSKLISDREE